jgi:hypothetical protein
MARWRFRLRTLMAVSAAAALAAGGLRWRYDQLVAAHDRDLEIVESAEFSRADSLWTDVTTVWSWKFRRVEQLRCEECPDLATLIPRLHELTDLETIQVLARQIIGHASAAADGKADPVIEALRAHPTLHTLVVDASIRGTPLEFEAPIYTREDLARLEEVLPNLKVEWIEVN